MNQTSLFEAIVTGKPVRGYFNTTHLSGPELTGARQQATTQDNRVLALFRELGKMTPLRASREYDKRYPPSPATSIRRSVTVLTSRGMLVKLTETVKEVYGKVNYLWTAD